MSNITKKIKELFYKKKYRNGYYIIRILFFRFKINNQPSDYHAFRFVPGGIKVGKNTYTGVDIKLASLKTTIGSFCSIGHNVVLGHGEHPLNFLSSSPYFYFQKVEWKNANMPNHNEFLINKPIEVGNDVWIGDGVFVKNGITVGDGAILGAKSVVTRDVPPYAIVAGVPARIIKYRFDEKTIKELLELKWWELDDEIIKRIPYDNIEKAIDFLREVRQK